MTVGQCSICLKRGVITREHVWPNWFLQRMDREGPPPYGWSVNGNPLLTRRGVPIKGERRQRVMLPVCNSCNATMNICIEVPARLVVEPLALNGWRGTYDQEQWRAVGLWWAKVLLLIGHPQSSLENPRLQKLVKMNFDSEPDIRWLTDRSDVPAHVSVFVHNVDFSSGGTEHELTVPARVLFDDETSAECHMLSMATPGMAVAVVSHPGITIEHPLVEAGHAWELLHSPPRRGDIGDFKPLAGDSVRYIRGGSVPEGHIVDGGDASLLAGLFGYEADQLAALTPLQRLRDRLRRLVRWS